MNQSYEYLAIGIIGAISAATLGALVFDEYDVNFTSQHDKMELQMKKSGELLKIIDVLDSPLRIDVLNKGNADIQIKKIFIDGVDDINYTIDGQPNNIIPLDRIVIILPSITDGERIKIITENNKEISIR